VLIGYIIFLKYILRNSPSFKSFEDKLDNVKVRAVQFFSLLKVFKLIHYLVSTLGLA